MNLDFVRQLRFEPIVQRYDERDSALYALSLGMGEDPLDEDELPFIYEGRGPRAVPSQCVTLCWPPFWHKEPAAQISWRRILHGEQSFTLSRPLPAQAAVRGHRSIVSVDDKGSTRGAVLYTAQDLVEAENGEPLASLQSAEFLRDEGGSGGFGAPPTLTRPMGSVDEPTAVVDYRTSPQAALLYRQASRDYRHCARRRLRTPDFAWIEHVRPRVPSCAQVFRPGSSGDAQVDVGSVRSAGLPWRHGSDRTVRDDGRSAFPRARWSDMCWS